jgi:hypothetical protein
LEIQFDTLLGDNVTMIRILICGIAFWLFQASETQAWWIKGHGQLAEAAAQRLPESMPVFFRKAGKQLAHLSGDPDRWKNRDARYLRAAESPDHYLDLEDYEGKDLPADRFKAIALLIQLGRKPEQTGMLPYAILENYDRLTCAFADWRADPENEAARMKCVVYAGILAHFTGDLAMPLHTTRDYDGKKGVDGAWIQKGIHARIDAFPEKHGLGSEEISRSLEPKQLDDVWAEVLKRIQESHRRIGQCYDLDAMGAMELPTPESRAFILDCCRSGAQLTLDLWYTAWIRSAKLPPPF